MAVPYQPTVYLCLTFHIVCCATAFNFTGPLTPIMPHFMRYEDPRTRQYGLLFYLMTLWQVETVPPEEAPRGSTVFEVGVVS